ncbi:MAG: GNAT family N-acetyltransferase [Flavobacteriales bacterium]|jgi:arginine-tRNA-protein transferase
MLVQTAPIHGLRRTDYDALLGKGWFRGTGIIYRSEVVCIDEQVYGIRNIRFPVRSFSMRRSHAKLFRKNMKRFTLRVGTPRVDARREELYRGQMHRFKAFVHETLEDILLSPRMGAEIDAMEIGVYDGEKLVAVSYIDAGESSMASILCLYDPAYARFSLGTFTMLLEIDMAKRLGLDYYYPGYVLDLPSGFDYKLELGPCEWLHKEDGWNWLEATAEEGKASIIRGKMDELEAVLKATGRSWEKMIYPYYTLGHLIHERTDLVRVPAFWVTHISGHVAGISYDIQLDHYVAFDLNEALELDHLHQLKLSNDYLKGHSYVLQTLSYNHFVTLRDEHVAGDLNDFMVKLEDSYTIPIVHSK